MTARRGLFVLALGYFGCYVPYGAITKALTSQEIAGGDALSGLALVPMTTLASLVSMLVTITLLGWWQHASLPSRWTFTSGLATAMIVITTTLAYTFEGTSIVFVMLVMRGGVLAIAPIVDVITGRHVRWFSWIALALSLASLGNALFTSVGIVTLACAIDLALYLVAYFVRLQLIARRGKSAERAVRLRYFVEEQVVATPAALVALALLALFAPAELAAPLRDGFTGWHAPTIGWALLAGVCSQGTGMFGGLMLLGAQETTYVVPLNRAASILGGVAATVALALGFGASFPTGWELVGAGLLVVSIGVLWIGPTIENRRDASTRG